MGIEEIVFGEGERSVPCEACDGEGAVQLERVSTTEETIDLMRVCKACGGFGWREP